MSIETSFEADTQFAETGKPCVGAFDYPAMSSEFFATLDTAAGDTCRDTSLLQRFTAMRIVVTLVMIGVELPSDAIRFALLRDNPLTLLRNIKQAGAFVKFVPELQRFEDARTSPKWTFQRTFHLMMLLIIIPYAALVLLSIVGQLMNVAPLTVAALFTFDLIVMPILVVIALRADAAGRLLNAGTIYPLPHVKQSNPGISPADPVTKPRARRAPRANQDDSRRNVTSDSDPNTA